MATTSSSSSSWMLILACLIVLLCKECHSLTEYNLYLEAEDLIYNPEFRENHVHRSVRQAVDNTPVTENITKVDNHNYYRVTYHSGVNNEGSRYWVDLTQLKAKKHPNLSTNPRLAAKLPLEFEFPYYGHNVTELFLTTGGFMYLGSYVHRYLAATQYIAPLMDICTFIFLFNFNLYVGFKYLGSYVHRYLAATQYITPLMDICTFIFLFNFNLCAGFMYLGSYVHRYLAATQYIAPLMDICTFIFLFNFNLYVGFKYLGSYVHRYLAATQYIAPLMDICTFIFLFNFNLYVGFKYMGSYVHRYLAATQYIAPLMDICTFIFLFNFNLCAGFMYLGSYVHRYLAATQYIAPLMDICTFIFLFNSNLCAGFMYLGSYVHRYLAATQYIAPLMANFDPASSVNCSIKYFSNGSLFISEWTNIQLGDNPLAGLFSFQSTLRDNGEITFAYKKIPIPIANISDEAHPMKTGIADAFYIDQKLSQWIKKRTIYEYHRVALDTTYVNNATAVTITPLPTCNLHKDCESCANSKISFNCSWCSTAKRCSDDGLDRHRQSWINAECDKDINIADVPYNCPLPTIRPTTRAPQSTMGKHPSIYTDCSEGISCFNGGACRYGECICPTLYTGRRCERYVPRDGKGNQMAREGESKDDTTLALRIGTIVGSVVIGVLVLVLVGWLVYAYRYPNSNSGLFLIEITKFRLRKKEENGVGYHYHKPDDNDEVDIII
ncbi:plexin domain-containing protein 2-like isoform X1 [Lytechinus variegatus]|uniref:plexin domain-containing protein 2-like isoform X1 n=1 Tax=Lytechinus variegatus TaxID=7654 RepID=UPI001BB27044|nr:plexin domain-containing protein 2-like isoform X1 [Lytechinus variegatus]XP_041456387.1 plexin domain-containing protein 2-like isoform X1 [Lytechinus variegatus]XP_041456388.1 plexin domain-containing protein 2-like isoform X1 [Lytechinus variegatus]XP_041456389.1 plexin domain-containing protein 2-like isoform X1 [Lytechinus variegatus]XP_041456390.1 plexin domain-containing protein 2-like isoform X1 [Lytechinus variegatus]